MDTTDIFFLLFYLFLVPPADIARDRSSGSVVFFTHGAISAAHGKKSGTVRQCHGILTKYLQKSKNFFLFLS